MAAAVPPEQLRMGIAITRAAMNAGIIIGPPIGALVAAQHFQLIFLIDAATSLIPAGQLLPRLQEMTTPEDQLVPGDLIAEATRRAPTRPHPYTPDRPPWNRMLDPMVGVMDRLRDRASGRKTSPDQL